MYCKDPGPPHHQPTLTQGKDIKVMGKNLEWHNRVQLHAQSSRKTSKGYELFHNLCLKKFGIYSKKLV